MSDDRELEPGRADFDVAHFRQVVGHFCTGVTVVAGMYHDQPVGFTAQSFTSVSLLPPLVSICPSRRSATWPLIREGGAFCASVLADDQEVIGRRFATPGLGADRFRDVAWTPSPVTGSPVLSGAVAWVDCRPRVEHEAGDHVIVVADVVALGVGGAAAPLLFYRGGYSSYAR